MKSFVKTSARLLCVLLALGVAITPAGAAEDRAVITGHVLDPLGGAIPNAPVALLRDGRHVAETTSDAEGRFALYPPEPGRYRVHADAPGFEPLDTDASFVAAGNRVALDVTLQIGPLVQQVVVSAAATELPQSQVGASVAVLDRELLQSVNKPDVLEALRLVPGVQVVQTGQRGGTTSIFVRGGNANFNKVLIDGVPANDIGGAFEFANLPTTGVERVEILKGPNSVLYGADAISSVISITTRRGTSGVPELSYAVDGGNLGTVRQELSLGGARRQFDYFSAFSHFDTRNDLPNDAFHNGTFSGRFGWAINGSTRLTVTGRRIATTQGVPGGFDYYEIANDSSQTNHNTHIGALLQMQSTPRWSNTVRFTSTDLQYHYVNPSPTGDPFDPFGYGPNYLGRSVTIQGANGFSASGRAILDYGGTYPQSYDSSTTSRAVSAQSDYQFAAGLGVSAGIRFENEQGSTDSGIRSTTERRNSGSFVEVREALRERVYVTAGVGFDHNAVFGFAATPRVSLASYLRRPSSRAAIGATKLVFNYGKGVKEPAIYQETSSLFTLVSSLPQGAGSISTFGLSPIAPERSRSIDVGVEQGVWGERGKVRATFFDTDYADLIEYVSKAALPQLGIPRDVASATAFGAYVNSSSYRARGLEMAFDGKIGGHVFVGGEYTYVDAVVTQSFASSALKPAINPAYPGVPIGAFSPLVGGRPFRRAPHSGSVRAALVAGAGQVSVVGYFVGRQDGSTFLTDAYFGNSLLLPNQDLQAGYQKVDLSGAYRIGRRLRFYAVVENVLNERYEAALGYPALPVTVSAGFAVTVGGAKGSRE